MTGHVKDLVVKMVLVVGPSGGEDVVPYSLTIDVDLIDAERRDVETAAGGGLHGKAAAEAKGLFCSFQWLGLTGNG
jgi:hypothetical protein